MNPLLIPVDIPGLDLALGGGIWAVQRLPDKLASANLLIRGPPGSGKTAIGTQLAEALGKALGGDVAYGCVELLPVELQAQYSSLRRGRAQERVVVPPFAATPQVEGSNCRIFAGLLDLGKSGREQDRIEPAVLALLDEVKSAGGNPRVLVVDSLSDGYGLSNAAPRVLADNLCKLAIERELSLVLLEESADSRLSPWNFAVDIVMELSIAAEEGVLDASGPSQRAMRVVKNRFGPSDAGPHYVSLRPPGLRILPRPSAYLPDWAREIVLSKYKPIPDDQGWSIQVDLPHSWPSFRDCVTAVYGSEASLVYRTASSLGLQTRSGTSFSGITLFVDFMAQVYRQIRDLDLTKQRFVGAGDPFLTGHMLLALLRKALDDIRADDKIVRKVLIGDLRSIRSFRNPDAIRRAIIVVLALLREAQIPAVLFETSPPRRIRQGLILADSDQPEPSVVDLANVVIEHRSPSSAGYLSHVIMTDVRSNQMILWDIPKPSEGG